MVYSSVRRCFLAALLWLTSEANAQVRIVTINQKVRVIGEPLEATLLVSDDSRIIALTPAVVSTPVPGEDLVEVVGRVAIASEVEGISSLAVLTSKTGEVSSSYRRIDPLSAEPVLMLDKTSVEARLREQQDTLKRWEGKLRAQEATLTRLQEDADVITNVSKIVGVEDQLEAVKVDSGRLKESLDLASKRLKALKQQSSPPNFKRREAELSEQLNQLSTALKTTEASALSRIATASAELREKLALIEATKGKQMSVLQAELARVRKEREQLESDLGIGGRRGDEGESQVINESDDREGFGLEKP